MNAKVRQIREPEPSSLPTKRTTLGLRDTLFTEMDDIRAGRSNPQRSHAIAKLATQIINTARLELDFHRFVKGGSISGAGGLSESPVLLGSSDAAA